MIVEKDKRRIFYTGDIDESLSEQFTQGFLELDQADGDITIIASSFGGDYDTSAIQMMDVILGSRNHIIFYGYGAQASSQSFIFLAADERYLSSDRSYLMLHAGRTGGSEEGIDLREFEKASEIISYQMNQDFEYFSSRSNRPPSYFKNQISRGDFYIFPEKAMELGLISGVKGVNE